MAAITVKGRRYVRLDNVVFATVEKRLEWMLTDEKFEQKIKNAYRVQVQLNGGWSFTVRHEGYVFRFDEENTTKYKLPIIYEGYTLEEPETIQKTLLEVTG
ncbi:MAG: hypothetical protein QXK47_02265 [Candidatus Bathyarchaeia archaeon]